MTEPDPTDGMATRQQLDAARTHLIATQLCHASAAGRFDLCEAIRVHEHHNGRSTELLVAVTAVAVNLAAALAETTGRATDAIIGGLVLRAEAQLEGLTEIIRMTDHNEQEKHHHE